MSTASLPKAIISKNFEDLLADEEVELIVVNTPNQLHAPMAKAALLAGKHVVVEKPFAITVAEGQALIDLAKSKKLSLNVYHNKRFEGEFKTVQELIQNRTVGDISLFETHFDRYRPDIGPKKWKEEDVPGAGLLYDLGPHMIDQALVLFGMPLAITADLEIQRAGGKVVDYFHITLHYDNHDAVVTAGMLVQGAVVKYFIHGENGTYVKYGSDPQEELLKQGVRPLGEDWGREPAAQWGKLIANDKSESFVPTAQGSYMDYYTSVYDNIRNLKAPAIEPEEALNVMRIIEMAVQSNLVEGKRVEL